MRDSEFINKDLSFDKYYEAELNACKLLNSENVKHKWKKDFRKDNEADDDWDIINSEGIKIEVKSTIREKSFRANRVRLNTPNQYNNIIIKLLIDEQGNIKEYKFVKKFMDGWSDITNKILCKN